jgi:hypothetical protein
MDTPMNILEKLRKNFNLKYKNNELDNKYMFIFLFFC